MAQINFNNISTEEKTNNISGVSFFALKNDGDEAIVRFAHDSTDSFEILSCHNITVNGKCRKVNCVRDWNESADKCPLCAGGDRANQRFFIRLIQYVRNEKGEIVAVPKVWERSASFANTIATLISEYGPLTNSIFKIKRQGAAGSTDTTYSILFGNPSVYPDNLYPKNFDAFKNYSALKTIVMDKSAEELKYFTENRAFPAVTTNSNTVAAPQAAAVSEETQVDVPFTMNDAHTFTSRVTPAFNGAPDTNNNTTFNRPVRYY